MQKIYTFIFSRLSALLLVNLLFTSGILFGQASTPGGSVRLTLLGGGNVQFIFSSMKDYQTGLTFTNWSTLGISVRDEAGDINPPVGDDYTTWQISFQAQDADGDGFMDGVNPANKIFFSCIEVKATKAAGCATCNVFGSPFVPLAIAPGSILVDGSSGGGWPPDQIRDVPSADNLTYGSDQINLTYRCGNAGSLFGKQADYYSDVIVFTLTMSP